jgi:hypothetical protein
MVGAAMPGGRVGAAGVINGAGAIGGGGGPANVIEGMCSEPLTSGNVGTDDLGIAWKAGSTAENSSTGIGEKGSKCASSPLDAG